MQNIKGRKKRKTRINKLKVNNNIVCNKSIKMLICFIYLFIYLLHWIYMELFTRIL